MKGLRLRPWIIGIGLLICGFAVHVSFEIWVAGWAGRSEMGSFAFLEAVFFLAGLGCVLIRLFEPWPADYELAEKVGAWILWLMTAFLTAWAVLTRLPP